MNKTIKKLAILTIALALLLGSFSVALAAPWDNPHGYWLTVTCQDHDPESFDVWVHNSSSFASFDEFGNVGVTKAVYIYDEDLHDYVLLFGVPGNGVFKNTMTCYWEVDGYQFMGKILGK